MSQKGLVGWEEGWAPVQSWQSCVLENGETGQLKQSDYTYGLSVMMQPILSTNPLDQIVWTVSLYFQLE